MQDETPLPKPVGLAVHAFVVAVSLALAIWIAVPSGHPGLWRIGGVVALLNGVVLEFVAAAVVPLVFGSYAARHRPDRQPPSRD